VLPDSPRATAGCDRPTNPMFIRNNVCSSSVRREIMPIRVVAPMTSLTASDPRAAHERCVLVQDDAEAQVSESR